MNTSKKTRRFLWSLGLSAGFLCVDWNVPGGFLQYVAGDLWTKVRSENIFLCIFECWLVAFLVYWLLAAGFLSTDVRMRPERLWKLKTYPGRQFLVDGSPNNPPLLRMLKTVLFNQTFVFLLCVELIQAVCLLLNLNDLPWQMGVDNARVLPSVLKVSIHLSLGFVVDEILYYTVHSIAHRKDVGVHKMHHAYIATYATSSLNVHPIEMLVARTLAPCLPAQLLGFHSVTWCVFLILLWTKDVLDHCGYELYLLRADFCDIHAQHVDGNYGKYGFLDTLLETRSRYAAKKTTISIVDV